MLDDLPELTERHSILEVLEKAPSILSSHAVNVVEKRKEYDRAKHDRDVALAKAKIKHQDKRNQELIKAAATAEEEVVQAEVKVIEKRAEYEIADIKHREIYDRFISARKVAGLDEQELSALRGQTIKGGVVKDEHGNIVNRNTGEVIEHAQSQ